VSFGAVIRCLRLQKVMLHALLASTTAAWLVTITSEGLGLPLLLLSIATNQWQHRDAREEVRALVQQLNTGGPREFSFPGTSSSIGPRP
jgi:hypothetical protein